jgi:hypothetical protein
MYPPIFQVAAAAQAVTALIGASPVRLYPFGEAPQDETRPYAVWQTIGGSPENFLGNLPDLDSYSLQVDVYATTATASRNVAKALRDAIEPRAHITRWGGESREADTKLYRVSFDVEWFVPR